MRIAIVGGAGGVGSSTAFNLLLSPSGHDVAIVDRRPEKVLSHTMDLEQTLEQLPGGHVRHGSPADVAAAEIVILCASTQLTLNTSRMVYLDTNAGILASALEPLDSGWPGVLIVVTNPVDPLCTWLQQHTGIDRRRVLGYTLNDSLRLRTGVAHALGLELGEVEAWVIGEHGELSVPLYDRVRVNGAALQLDEAQRAEVEDFIRNWYRRHVALNPGRSSTWTSGLGLARMVAAIEAGGDGIWPASVLLQGEYGIEGVSLSVPVSLGRGGAEQIHEWELTAEQREALAAAAQLVREAVEDLENAG